MYREAKGRSVIFTRSVHTDFSWLHLPAHGDKILLFSWYGESIFHAGVLSPVFRNKKRAQTVPFVSAVSQVPSAQNNPYAEVAYFGMACSATLYSYFLFPNITLERNIKKLTLEPSKPFQV